MCRYYLTTRSPNSVKIKTTFALPYKLLNYLRIIFAKDQDSEYDESSKLANRKSRANINASGTFARRVYSMIGASWLIDKINQ